jgi:hypothetical protein
MRGHPVVPRLISMVLVGILTSCGGGGGDSGDPTNPDSKAGVTLSISPSNLTLPQGKSGTVAVTVTRSSGLKGVLTPVISNLPAEITGTFDPPSLAEGVSATTLTVAVGSNAAVASATPLAIDVKLNGTPVNINNTTAPTISLVVKNARPSVNITKAGTGTGTVTSSPAGINCSGTSTGCNAQFDALVPITLTAVPATGSVFTSWSGGLCAGTAPTCAFTPNDFGNVITATFTSIAPAIALAASPSAVTVSPGGSATTTLTVTRVNGFADPVAITASAPTGISVSANPASVTGTTSTLTMSAGASVAAGSYPVTITATANGVTTQSVSIPVQVVLGAGGGTIAYNFAVCERKQIPVWFAVQNGAGPWTRVTPSGNTFTFNVGATGAIATVIRDGAYAETRVTYGSAAELAAFSLGLCREPVTGTRRVIGTFVNSGSVATTTTRISISGSEFTRPDDQTQGFTLANTPSASGPRDLIATRTNIGNPTLSRLILRRGTNYTSGNAGTVDFSTSESVIPKQAGLTIPNAGTDVVYLDASLITTYGESVPYYSFAAVPPALRAPYYGLPDTLLRDGDFHRIQAAVASPDGRSFRVIQTLQRSVADKTVSFGPALGSTPTVTTIGTSPTLRLRAQFPTAATYTTAATAQYSQNDNAVLIFTSAAYLATTPTTWSIDIPDLSAAGFDAAWGLKNGTGVSWAVFAVTGNTLALNGGVPVDGATTMAAGAQDSSASFPAALRKLMRRSRP